MYGIEYIRETDGEIADAISAEIGRQTDHIELIASENFVSKAVMAAMGTPLTNKYAEGYPGKRYYGGCAMVDRAERLAIKRAKDLFGAEHANVQPHSGAQANTAVYFAVLRPGDTILGMNLSHGGHLSHGSPVNISGKYYNVVPYGVDGETERIDYEALYRLAMEIKPTMIVAGSSAYSRTIDFKRFGEIAKEAGAYLMADIAHIAGMVATGLHPSPVPYADFVTTTTHKTLRGPRGGMILCREEHAKALDKAVFPGIQGGPLMHVIAAKAVALKEAADDSFKEYIKKVLENAAALSGALQARGFRIVSGGTDTHLMMVDMHSANVTGREAEKKLDSIGITCNKNVVPFDERSAYHTSGIRLGTPAVTTRGFAAADMEKVALAIDEALNDSEAGMEAARAIVGELIAKYPMDRLL